MSRATLWSPALLILAMLVGCSTGVDPSPNPGTVQIVLKANEMDTTLIIQSDTSRFSRWDSFELFVSQGRIYRGDNYIYLYATPGTERISAVTVNIIGREWLNGVPITSLDAETITPRNSRYRSYVLFSSLAPPGTYDKISFSLTAREMDIFFPKVYQNPVQIPEGESPQVEIPATFTVHENGTTRIELQISPFQALKRYRDSFMFDRKITVVNIQNL